LAEYIIQAAQRCSGDATAPPDDQTVVVVRRTEDMVEALVPPRPLTLAHAAGF
jgi:hypothetical protein